MTEHLCFLLSFVLFNRVMIVLCTNALIVWHQPYKPANKSRNSSDSFICRRSSKKPRENLKRNNDYKKSLTLSSLRGGGDRQVGGESSVRLNIVKLWFSYFQLQPSVMYFEIDECLFVMIPLKKTNAIYLLKLY